MKYSFYSKTRENKEANGPFKSAVEGLEAGATRSGWGLPWLRSASLTLSAKPLSRDDRMLVPRKTQGLYFKTFCQKRPLEHIQPLDRIPEGQTAVAT